jgi:hypothetical protein
MVVRPVLPENRPRGDALTHVLLFPLEPLVDDMLTRTLSRAPDLVVHHCDGRPEHVRDAMKTLNPDWAILGCRPGTDVDDYIRLFDLGSKVKILALAKHAAQSIVCVQLGQLSPETLLRALERIDAEAWADGAG